MKNTDLSILAMFTAQPSGVVKTGGLITGDGAFLAFLGQQTAIEQPNIQMFTGQSTVSPAPLLSPHTLLTDSIVPVAAPTPPMAPETIMPAPIAKAEPTSIADIFDGESLPSLPVATASAPSMNEADQPVQTQPFTLAPQLSEAPVADLPKPDKVVTISQVAALVQASVANTLAAQPKAAAPLATEDETKQPTQPIAQSESAKTSALPQAPLPFDTAPAQASISPAPHSITPEALLEPTRKEPPASPRTPSIDEQAMLAPLTDSQPTPAGNDGVTLPFLQAFALQPVPAPPQPTTSDLAPTKAALSVSRLFEHTPDAGPNVLTPAQPFNTPYINQKVDVGTDAKPETILPAPKQAPLPNRDITEPQATVLNANGAPPKTAPTSLLENGSVTKEVVLSMDEAQPPHAVVAKASSEVIAPEVLPQTTDQTATADFDNKEVKTSQTMVPYTIPQPKLTTSSAIFPSEATAQPAKNVEVSHPSHTSKIIALESAAKPNAVAFIPRNLAQNAPKPIPQTDAQTLAPPALPNPETKALPTAIGAAQMVQLRTFPQPSPKTLPAENAVPVVADKLLENTIVAGEKSIPPTLEKQSMGSSPKVSASPPNDLMPPAPDRSEPVQAPEKTSLYSSAFTQTGFSTLNPTAPAVQTPNVQPGPVPVSAIAEQIKTYAQAEKPSAIELTLTPDDLGKIRLYMAPDGDKIRIFIHADRPETLELIRRNTESFSADLRQAGYSNASFSFSGSNGRQSTQQDRQNTKNGFDSATDDAIATAAPKPTSRQINLSGLNLRV